MGSPGVIQPQNILTAEYTEYTEKTDSIQPPIPRIPRIPRFNFLKISPRTDPPPEFAAKERKERREKLSANDANFRESGPKQVRGMSVRGIKSGSCLHSSANRSPD
jgi:hypothetical protein